MFFFTMCCSIGAAGFRPSFTSTRRWAFALRPEHHPGSDQSGHVEQPACRTRCPKEPHAQRSWQLQCSPPAQSEDLPPEVWSPSLSDDESLHHGAVNENVDCPEKTTTVSSLRAFTTATNVALQQAVCLSVVRRRATERNIVVLASVIPLSRRRRARARATSRRLHRRAPPPPLACLGMRGTERCIGEQPKEI